ncbi:hypothetical protein BH09PAT1_BH09PAT1_4770 [soil metagenome]
MKKQFYTPEFFKNLINRDGLEIEVTRNEPIEAVPTRRALETLFSLFSPTSSSQNRI